MDGRTTDTNSSDDPTNQTRQKKINTIYVPVCRKNKKNIQQKFVKSRYFL